MLNSQGFNPLPDRQEDSRNLLRRLSDSRFVTTPLKALSKAAHSRADHLTAQADLIVQEAFNEHFSDTLINELGLTLVATGSYGRRLLVLGHSDIDLALFAQKKSFDSLTKVEQVDLETALAGFRIQITEAFKALELEVDENIQCRELGDLKIEIEQAESGKLRECKKAVESLTKFRSMRILCVGQFRDEQELRDEFEVAAGAAWREIAEDRTLLTQAVKLLINIGSSIIGDHQLSLAQQDVKAQPLTLASINLTLVDLLKNQSNSEALGLLQAELKTHVAFLAGVREALPREAQMLGPKCNKSLPFAIARIYGEQPGVVSSAYKASAWIATCFELLAAEAAKSELVTLARPPQFPLAGMRTSDSPEDLRGLFYNSGNVALGLHLGFLQSNFTKNLPELAELEGVPDRHGYQRFTLGRHAINAEAKLDELFRGQGDPRFVSLANELTEDDKSGLAFAVALHDCGKIEEMRLGKGREFHALFGSELAVKAAERLGFSLDQIRTIKDLIANHLWLRQDSQKFRENIAQGVSSIPEAIRSPRMIKLLTLLAYVDEASQDTTNWNGLRSDRLHRLYHGYSCIVDNKPHALVLRDAGEYAQYLFAQHRESIPGDNMAELQRHLSLLPAEHLSLPPETVCDLFNLAKVRELSNEPQVRVIPHARYESDRFEGLNKFDVLIVGSDKEYLASNCVKVLTEHALTVHSASFSVNNVGVVFNQFTVTSPSAKTPESLEKISHDLLSVNNSPTLIIPKVPGFSFSEDTKLSIALCERKEGDRVVLEININTRDQNRLLLRCLAGLNRLNLSIVGAEITTTTDESGQCRANNRFFVIQPKNEYEVPDLGQHRALMFREFRDPE